jgi:GTP cyclohydrolase I
MSVSRENDNRGITLSKAGIKGLHLPLLVREKEGGSQSVLATIDLTVELPHHFRGTHMSRFVEILSAWTSKGMWVGDLKRLLKETTEQLQARRADLLMRFRYFVAKKAPSSGRSSALDYPTVFHAALNEWGFALEYGVEVPVLTVCPCSMDIATEGAHSQRALIRAKLRFLPDSFIWLEDLVRLLEQQGSSEVYPLLKQADEKLVTERAWQNPKFVEDVVRDCALALRRIDGLAWFSVECEAMESIHNHSAYAAHEETVGDSLGPEA